MGQIKNNKLHIVTDIKCHQTTHFIHFIKEHVTTTTMVQSASSTTVGAGGSKPSGAPRAGSGSTVRARKGTATGTSATTRRAAGGGPQNMWRFYTEDSPGIKVGP